MNGNVTQRVMSKLRIQTRVLVVNYVTPGKEKATSANCKAVLKHYVILPDTPADLTSVS
jgi:hypothetical protein